MQNIKLSVILNFKYQYYYLVRIHYLIIYDCTYPDGKLVRREYFIMLSTSLTELLYEEESGLFTGPHMIQEINHLI